MNIYVELPPEHARDENTGKLPSSAPSLVSLFWSILVLPGAPQYLVLQGVFDSPLANSKTHTHENIRTDHSRGDSRRPYKTTKCGLAVAAMDTEQVHERQRPVRGPFYKGHSWKNRGVRRALCCYLVAKTSVACVLSSLVITAIRRAHAARVTRLNVLPLVYPGYCVMLACADIPAVSRFRFWPSGRLYY